VSRLGGRLKSAEQLARGRAWAARRGVSGGARVKVGRGCRLILEPGATLHLGEIDDGTTVAVYPGGTLRFGAGVFVGHHCTVGARLAVDIGDGSFLAELVSVRDHDHDPAQPPSTGAVLVTPVRIGRDVWLAAKVTVLRGATIGDRAVIAANAVVRGDVPAGVVAGGIPAKVLRP
jgi:acetyltransferase-like isoleucine patch superfamily enzyme